MASADSEFSRNLRDDLTDAEKELLRIEDIAEGVSHTLTRSLRSAIIDGRSLKSLLSDIGRTIADISLRAALQPVGNLAQGFISSLLNATSPVKAFAKGGVIASPSYFPMRNGMGLAGEAGPEAILPLTRDSQGRLGVAGGSAPVSISVNVTARDAQSFAGAEAEISAMLLRAVKRGRRAS